MVDRKNPDYDLKKRSAHVPGRTWLSLLSGLIVVCSISSLIIAASCNPILQEPDPEAIFAESGIEFDPDIAGMLEAVKESELETTVADLQSFETRVVGTDGNQEAAAYLYDRLSDIPGLDVSYQGGDLRNVVATLPGTDPASDSVVVVGAHYDSTSSDPGDAPGATDNGAGVAIVLELARIMSQYRFDETVVFAFWNAEETDRGGSRAYADRAAEENVSIPLYLNFDSAGYDPEGRFILDIMHDERGAPVADRMILHNALYGINLTLTENVYTCTSDHLPFRDRGYVAVMTHQDGHGPAHTPEDTADQVSLPYAKRNAQLGLSVLAEVAGVQDNVTAASGERR
ncbi:peptidase M28 [Methanoculleus taiwanensis]|uniref:Peptidase M28 n=1 Tax=Methanoculleus taiwanensis TaxID=1550565 RepID=A0A498GXX0_9EURY|nr:M28 family metallopeptidase [Methanoculleus taiwanensis]RXE55589.1 peptidase M28 [Methanoculleus taiwanensis]